MLILSGREKPEEKVLGLDLGADDYLVKPFSLNELQARVRALLRRGQRAAGPVISYGDLNFDTVGRTASVNGQALPLSAHEFGVLEVLIHRFGRVVSKEQIVEQLYSYDKDVSQNAIEVYVHRLRRKLEGSGSRCARCTVAATCSTTRTLTCPIGRHAPVDDQRTAIRTRELTVGGIAAPRPLRPGDRAQSAPGCVRACSSAVTSTRRSKSCSA